MTTSATPSSRQNTSVPKAGTKTKLGNTEAHLRRPTGIFKLTDWFDIPHADIQAIIAKGQALGARVAARKALRPRRKGVLEPPCP